MSDPEAVVVVAIAVVLTFVLACAVTILIRIDASVRECMQIASRLERKYGGKR